MEYLGDILGISLSERTSGVPPFIFTYSLGRLVFDFETSPECTGNVPGGIRKEHLSATSGLHTGEKLPRGH